MKLMTKEIANKMPKLYETENVKAADKIAFVKYFSINGWRWYGIEFDPETEEFFGLVYGIEKEWGYFSLEEFEAVNDNAGFNLIERDLYFEPTKISELERD